MNRFRAAFRCWWVAIRSRKQRRRELARLRSFPVEFATDPALRWVIALLPAGGPLVRVGLRTDGEGIVLCPERAAVGASLPESLTAELFALLEIQFPDIGGGVEDWMSSDVHMLAIHRRRGSATNEFLIVACPEPASRGRPQPAQRLVAIIRALR